jgi:O-antigen biosynthesis protein
VSGDGRSSGSTAALAHHVRRGVRVWRTSGAMGTAQRVARAVHRRVDAGALDFPLLLDDIADSRRLDLPVPARAVDCRRPLHVGWISTPPALRSGGHTTMFRMVSALEDAGHQCTIFLYDRYGGSVSDHELTIRNGWPSVRARVAETGESIVGVDACVATSWPTAHVLARRGRAPMRRLYFVQDFEPSFYPQGAEYALAEDSYRFGFRAITVGHALASLLTKRTGIPASGVDFGCDGDAYHLGPAEPRDGVVFYAKPGVARRGFLLGVLALRELRRRRPDLAIHFVGSPGVRAPFPAIHHGTLSPAELAALYNQTVAGLVLSFTNISLLPDELLACGTVPVVNDSENAPFHLVSEYVRWASPTPSGLADQLLDVLDSPPDPALVAKTASRGSWRSAQAAFVRAVEDETYGE